MKKLLTILLILFVSFNAYAGPNFGNSGSGSTTINDSASSSTTETWSIDKLIAYFQALNADLTAISNGGTANCLWGEKSDGSGIECKSTINIQMDDSAAQFKDATDTTKTFQIELGSITTGTKRTMTVPDADFTAVGTSTTQTLTNKIILPAEVDGHVTSTDLTAAQVSNTVIHNYDQAASDVFLIAPAAAAGYSALFTVITAQSNHWCFEAATNDKIYLIAAAGTVSAGDDGAAVCMMAAQVGQSFACWTFKSGASTYDWMCKAISIGTSTFEAHASSE